MCTATMSVAIKAVTRNIELPSYKPTCTWCLTFEHTIPGLDPAKLARNLIPESFRIALCLVIQSLVVFDVGSKERLGGRWKANLRCQKPLEIGAWSSIAGNICTLLSTFRL